MKITLIAYGTRGDVQPMLSLAYALKERGHAVRLLAPKNFESWVGLSGVPFAALPIDTQELFRAEAAQKMLARGDIQSFFKWLAEIEKPYEKAIQEAVIDATSDADLIVTHVLMEDRAAAVGAARKVPVVGTYFFPIPPSKSFPSPFITNRNLGLGVLNRLTHSLLLGMLWKAAKSDVAAMRRKLGAAPAPGPYTIEVKKRGLPCLLAYSRHVFPAPSDWPETNVVTGHWEPPAALRAALGESRPDALARWLKAGEPPVFMGFGSMPVLEPRVLLDAARAAAAATGTRAVVGAGWSTLARNGDDRIFIADEVDHSWLFPQCRAAVHHGGSGTFHASLAAGLPTVVCSVFADQPFWGGRANALGVGDTIPFAKLDARKLNDSLRRVLTPAVSQKARALAPLIREERGLDTALRFVEERAPGMPPPL